MHRALPSRVLAVLGVGIALALGGCDAVSTDADAPPLAEGPEAQTSLSCSAPSISTGSSGGYVTVAGLSSIGAVVEAAPYQTSQWYHIETGTSTVVTDFETPNGRPWVKYSFRARNICYDSATDTYSFSGLSNAATTLVYYLFP